MRQKKERTRIRNDFSIWCNQRKPNMLINDTNVKSLRMTKIFRENTDRINSCDFSRNGMFVSC